MRAEEVEDTVRSEPDRLGGVSEFALQNAVGFAIPADCAAQTR